MNNDKVLYYAVSSFHLLECLVHRIKEHSNDNCDLIISKYIPQKVLHPEYIYESFDRVYECELQVCGSRQDEYLNNINSYFESFCLNNDIDIRQYKQIYVCAAHYIFGIYLASNNIRFNFVEDANGMLSRYDMLQSIDSAYEVRAQIAQESGLYDGSAEAIDFCICNRNCQIDDKLRTDRLLHFNVTEQLGLLDKSCRDNIINVFYDKGTIETAGRTAVFLTQHFCNLKILSFEDQVLINQVFFDFFLTADKTIIKTHPDDFLYYKELFPESIVVHERFPSEFLPYIFDNKINTLATISSTAVFALESIYSDIIKFDSRYEKQFKNTLIVYAALKFMSESGISSFVLGGITHTLIDNLLKYSDIRSYNIIKNYVEDINAIGSDSVLLLGDDLDEKEEEFLRSESLSKGCTIIYTGKKFPFYNYEYRHKMRKCAVVELIKTRSRDSECYASLDRERIYIYSHDPKLIQKGEVFKMEKNLINQGINVKTADLDEKDKQIKILEGILKATEARLEFFIAKQRETENQSDKK